MAAEMTQFVGFSPSVFQTAVKLFLSMDFLHVMLLTLGILIAVTFGILELIHHTKGGGSE